MTVIEACSDMCRLLLAYDDDPELATSLERGLMTGALLALESDDIPRAKAIAKIALNAQQVKFKRV